MNFWESFFLVLRYRPSVALAALYWRVTRRRVRASNRLRAVLGQLPDTYPLWISEVERRRHLRDLSPEKVASWLYRPRFSIVVHASPGSARKALRRTIDSVEQQTYPNWSLMLVKAGEAAAQEARSLPAGLRLATEQTGDRGRALVIGLDSSDAEYVLLLNTGDALAETALSRIAEALQQAPGASIVYGDQDEIDASGRRKRPWFKPGWNREMFLALDYLTGAVAIHRDALGGIVARYPAASLATILLEASDAGRVIHVPHILCHVAGEDSREPLSRAAIVASHVQPLGATAEPGPFDTVRVVWPLPKPLPLVSVIVPTRDKLPILRQCIDSLLRLTDYAPIEVLVVDNGSVEAATHEYFGSLVEDGRIRVLRYDRPFNYSAINNFAAREARGEYLCLLNNDTEVIDGGWLTEMMRYATRADVGAVGAKLLYPDGTIQHAGVVVGMGEAAGHAHRFEASDQPGYFRQMHVAQFVSAVTAACLVVAKEKYFAVGGLDHQHLRVAYNDVDLCLKLQRIGWRNVYTPHAVLIHHESKSRGNDLSPEHLDRYLGELETLQARWGTRAYNDPLHNQNLDRYSETFTLRLD